MSWSKRLLFLAVTLLVVVAVLELAAFLFFRSQQDQYTFFDPRQYTVDDETIATKLRDYHDPTLGWKKPFSTEFGERPRERSYAETLLATFGDSYTYCDEVEEDETWQTYLSRLTAHNVLNFGNNGYGTGQALLRFREEYPRVRSPVVTLGLTADNIKRIVNVYRKFFYRKTGIPATKPRFVLIQDELELIANPIESVDDLKLLQDLDFLARIGKDDLWYNRNDYPRRSFPHLAILFNRSFWLEVEYGKLGNKINDVDPRPWVDLWQDELSRETMFAILDRFVAEAEELGATPIIMILPKKREVIHRLNEGRHRTSIEMIVEHCSSQGHRLFNAIDALAAETRTQQDIDSYYSGHVSALGNEIIARYLLRYLQMQGLYEGPVGANAISGPAGPGRPASAAPTRVAD